MERAEDPSLPFTLKRKWGLVAHRFSRVCQQHFALERHVSCVVHFAQSSLPTDHNTTTNLLQLLVRDNTHTLLLILFFHHNADFLLMKQNP